MSRKVNRALLFKGGRFLIAVEGWPPSARDNSPLSRGPVSVNRKDNLVYDGGFPSLNVASRNEDTRVRIPAAAPSIH